MSTSAVSARTLRWSAALAVMCTACTTHGLSGASTRAKPEQVPPELIASVALGPPAALRDLRAYVQTIRPGFGGMLDEQVVRSGLALAIGASSLDGFEPKYVLVAELERMQLGLLGAVTDAGKLAESTGTGAVRAISRGGWAVVGTAPVLDRIADYAFGVIAAQYAPAVPTATIYVPHVLARHKAELDRLRNESLDATPHQGRHFAVLDMVGSMVTEIDRLILSLEVTPELASLDIAATPRPGSELAKFVAAQRASDYAALGKLPEGAFLSFGGHLAAGPYLGLGRRLFLDELGATAEKEIGVALDEVRKLATGEVAASVSITSRIGLTVSMLYGVSSTKLVDRAIAGLLALLDGQTANVMGASARIDLRPGTTVHNGVGVRSYEIDYQLSRSQMLQQIRPALRDVLEASLAQMRGYVAAFDGPAMLVVGNDSLAAAMRLIDAAHAKAAEPAELVPAKRLIAESRARKDSALAMIDVGLMLSTFTGTAAGGNRIMTLAFGCPDSRAHIRISVPATLLNKVPVPGLRPMGLVVRGPGLAPESAKPVVPVVPPASAPPAKR